VQIFITVKCLLAGWDANWEGELSGGKMSSGNVWGHIVRQRKGFLGDVWGK